MTNEPVAVHMTWSEYLTAIHVAFAAGVEHEYGERLRDEHLAKTTDFAQMATRLRATAGEPSHTELVARGCRHQVAAGERARQAAEPWPQEPT